MDSVGKVCKTCGKPKPAAQFYPRRAVCKVCVVAAERMYRLANYAHVRALERQTEQRNREAIRARRTSPEFREQHREYERQRRARLRGGAA
jgi:hypothetical protein